MAFWTANPCKRKLMFRQYREIQTFRFSLSADSRDLESGLASLYPALHAKPGTASVAWETRRIHDPRKKSLTYGYYEDGDAIFETEDIHELFDNLEWRITTRILQSLGHLVQVHASGLVAGGKALLLVGPSGAGKTSLALSLVMRGWKCLSDEVILVEPMGKKVWPLPRSFHVDAKTLGLFPELTLKDAGRVFLDDSGKRRFDPSFILNDWVAKPSAPAWIVFPNHSSGNRRGLIPLGETEALTLLLGQAINLVSQGSTGLDTLTELVRRCQCFTLNAPDLDSASRAVERLAEENHPQALCAPRGGSWPFPLANVLRAW